MKRIVLNLVVIVVFLMSLSGCYVAGEESKVSETKTGNYDMSPVVTTLLEGNGTGLWYMLSNGISECLNKNYKNSIINITPGNSNSNILRLNENQSEFALLHSNLAHSAYNGLGAYEEKQENLRAVATFYPSYAQFFLLESKGISSLEQLFEEKPKLRFSIGSAGGTFETAFIQLIDAYGYTIEDMESWGCRIERKSQSDASKMLSDGALDGFFVVASAPNPTAVENSVNKDLVLLKMDTGKIKYVSEEYGYSQTVISKDVYDFLDEDLTTFATFSFLAASADTPDEKVYKILRSISENLEYLKAIHASLDTLTLEYLASYQTIPMHPGAEKYFKEISVK